MPVELVALLSRSRPVVRQVPHWPCKGAGQAVVQHRGGIEGSHGVAVELSKAIAQLPATVLGSKHKGSLAEIDIVEKEQESPLEDIAINVTLPGQTRAIGVNELKNALKLAQEQFDDLKKALDMATPLREKVEEQKKRG